MLADTHIRAMSNLAGWSVVEQIIGLCAIALDEK